MVRAGDGAFFCARSLPLARNELTLSLSARRLAHRLLQQDRPGQGEARPRPPVGPLPRVVSRRRLLAPFPSADALAADLPLQPRSSPATATRSSRRSTSSRRSSSASTRSRASASLAALHFVACSPERAVLTPLLLPPVQALLAPDHGDRHQAGRVRHGRRPGHDPVQQPALGRLRLSRGGGAGSSRVVLITHLSCPTPTPTCIAISKTSRTPTSTRPLSTFALAGPS